LSSADRRRQEIEQSALLAGRVSSSDNSSGLTAGCSAGVFRAYQAHTAVNRRAGNVVQASALCQPKEDMSQATSGAVTAAPRPSPRLNNPCTNDH